MKTRPYHTYPAATAAVVRGDERVVLCELRVPPTADDAAMLFDAVARSTKLRGFGVHRCVFSAELLAAALKLNASVTELDLSMIEPRFGDAGAVLMARWLAASPRVTSFRLHACDITITGAVAIAAAIAAAPVLTTLDLEHNMLRDEGVMVIAAAVGGSRTLRELNLNTNRFGSPGAIALAAAICESGTLTNLRFACNGITDAAAPAFARAIKSSRTLANLSLSYNGFANAGYDAIAASLERRWDLSIEMASNADLMRGGESFHGMRRLAGANRRVHHNLKILALASAYLLGGAQTPAHKFTAKDGDFAVMHRIAGFLVEGVAVL